jgi:FkbH-like protein
VEELTVQSGSVEFQRRWRQLCDAPGERRPLRVALVGSFTLDTLVPYLGCFLAQRGFAPAFIIAPFNQVYQSLLDANGIVRSAKPDVVLVLTRLEDLCAPQLQQMATLVPDAVETARADAHAEVARLRSALLGFEQSEPSALVVGTLPPPASSPLGLLDASHPASLHHLVRELNLTLWHSAQQARSMRLVDIEEVFGALGTERTWDHRMAYLAGCPLSTAALRFLGARLARMLAALFLPAAKVVVVDLDNTLWGGIVGEDGPQGIVLGESGLGAAFVAFQEALLSLRAQGVLLAVASKNNEADVFQVFDNHPAMRLRREHWAASRIGWQSKSTSLKELAQELSLGLDSFVFVDDSATECAEVRRLLPQVTVIELPPDPARYVEVLRSHPALDRMRLTAEDLMRAVSFDAQKARARAQLSSADLSDPEALRAHLKSLELKVIVRRLRSGDVPRAAQLTQKTNQFNLTTIRRSEAEVEILRRDPEWSLYVLEVADRFGDYGQTGLIFARRENSHIWHLDTVLLSCRVLGRGVESAFLWQVIEDLAARGATTLTARVVPTAKNGPVMGFLPGHGFKCDSQDTWARGPLPGEPFAIDYIATEFCPDES